MLGNDYRFHVFEGCAAIDDFPFQIDQFEGRRMRFVFPGRIVFDESKDTVFLKDEYFAAVDLTVNAAAKYDRLFFCFHDD